MEPQPDLWVTETQSSLRGVTTASLTGQHSRLRRAKARENWYNTSLSNDGRFIKPIKFVDQQELRCQNNSKLLSSIRSHVKQDTYMKRQATKATLGNKKQPYHPHLLPKRSSNVQSQLDFKGSCPAEAASRCYLRKPRHCCSESSISRCKIDMSNTLQYNSLFSTYTGYDPLNRPRALFLLSHCKCSLISSTVLFCI